MTPFWWRWPSVVTELLSGALLAGVLWPWAPVPRFAIFLGVSLVYELSIDGNGWDANDFCQRLVGFLLVFAARLLW